MIVMKFGGTSVANSDALRRVAAIVTSHAPQHHGTVVVLSATSGTTTRLLQLAADAATGSNTDDAFDTISQQHLTIARELGVDHEPTAELLKQLYQHIDAARTLKECPPQSLDAVAAFGELLSTTVFHQYLLSMYANTAFVDARACVVTDDSYTCGKVDVVATATQTKQQIHPYLRQGSVIVTQGFIAATVDGITTTLGRGGSDYSASVLGSALDAQEIQIWTDVSGVYTCDPRIVAAARPLESISFESIRLLSRYGAKVLHPETVVPAIRAGIPVRVLNTFSPDETGTVITAESQRDHAVLAIALTQPCFRIQTDGDGYDALMSIDFIRHHVSLATITRSGNTIVVHTPDSAVQRAIDVAAVGCRFDYDEVACIAVVGARVKEPAVVQSIVECLQSFPNCTMSTLMQPSCVLITVELDIAMQACNALHALVSSPSS